MVVASTVRSQRRTDTPVSLLTHWTKLSQEFEEPVTHTEPLPADMPLTFRPLMSVRPLTVPASFTFPSRAACR